jgi:hypothetical protein
MQTSHEKCLVSEIYSIIRGIDIVFAISITLKIIIDQLGLMVILIIICINLYFFLRVSSQTRNN